MRFSGNPGFLASILFLGCAAGLSAAQQANPEGSYQQTCSDISVDRGTLYAKCQDTKGKSHSAKLSHYQGCSDIPTTMANLNAPAEKRPPDPDSRPARIPRPAEISI